MAKHDRCEICDYSEATGSGIAGISAGRNGKVRRYGNDLLCDSCIASVGETYTELVLKEDE